MNLKRILVATGLIILVLTLSASSASVQRHVRPRDSYPARVILTGNMTLTNDQTFNISVETNSTAMIPTQLAYGNYSASFEGEANVCNETIKFRGELKVDEFEFYVSFKVPNTEIPVEEEEEDYDAEGEFEITITRVTVVPKEKAWVRIRGYVDSYGEQEATGWLKADAKLGEWARVRALFVPGGLPSEDDIEDSIFKGNANMTLNGNLTIICIPGNYNITINTYFTVRVPEEIESYEGPATFEGLAYVTNNTILFKGKLEIEDEDFPVEFKVPNTYPELPKAPCLVTGELTVTITRLQIEPFSFTVYIARLVKASAISLKFSGCNFYISGLWDVYNITWTCKGEHDCNMTAKPVVVNATGEFCVTNDWHTFTLNIEGIESVGGKVVFLCFRLLRIPVGDVNNDYVVDIFDLVHAARRYQTKPGMADFDFDLDFDDDFEVDICDLTTIGASLGEDY